MEIICQLLFLYLVVIFGRVLMSWVQVRPGTGLAQVASVLDRLTEPVLGPLRRTVPPVRLGGMALDLSPLIVLFGIQIIMSILCG